MEGPTLRLIPGILAVYGCIGLALLNISAYIRHLADGDRTGFALGNLFLITWFLPITAIVLLLGVIVGRDSDAPRGGRLVRGILVSALIAGAGFFLAYGLWLLLAFRPPSHPSPTESLFVWSYASALFAFALNVLACVFAFLTDSTPPPRGARLWLTGLLLGATAMVVLPFAAIVIRSLSAKHPGDDDLLVAPLLFMLWPIVAWAVALPVSAWLLHRRKDIVPQESLNPGEA